MISSRMRDPALALVVGRVVEAAANVCPPTVEAAPPSSERTGLRFGPATASMVENELLRPLVTRRRSAQAVSHRECCADRQTRVGADSCQEATVYCALGQPEKAVAALLRLLSPIRCTPLCFGKDLSSGISPPGSSPSFRKIHVNQPYDLLCLVSALQCLLPLPSLCFTWAEASAVLLDASAIPRMLQIICPLIVPPRTMNGKYFGSKLLSTVDLAAAVGKQAAHLRIGKSYSLVFMLINIYCSKATLR